MNSTYYTLSEVLEGDTTWDTYLNDLENVRDVPLLLKKIYGSYYVAGPMKEGNTEEKYKKAKIGLFESFLTLWGQTYNILIKLDTGDNGPGFIGTARFSDTPESAGDYTSVEHTTTITQNKNSNSYGDFDKLAVYRNYKQQFMNDFRKNFLLSEDAI